MQGITDLGQHITTTEAQDLIGILQYYREMCKKRLYVTYNMEEAASVPKDRQIIRKDELELEFWYINQMVSAETLITYANRKSTFPVHTYTFDRHLGYVIIQNNNPIELFYIIPSKSQYEYILEEK